MTKTREIKFKGWNGMKMLEPQDLSQNGLNWRWLGKEDVILLQFTGLKDKHGKEIYEGDIVKIDEFGLCRVDYFDHSMKFYFQTLEGYDKQFTATPDKIEIIGNIYENPELLNS